MDPKLKSYLNEHNISYIEHKHPAVFTVEESKKIKQKIPGLSTKSLFLKDENNKYYLVSLPGEKRLNTKIIKRKLSLKDLHFASSEELKRELNLTPGSVSIFGMIYAKPGEVTLIIDKEVWKADKAGFHPNINTATLEISHKDLEKFYNSLNVEKYITDLNAT